MRSILLARAFAISVSLSGQAQQSPLPAPTGPYAVGRALFNWLDESRKAFFDQRLWGKASSLLNGPAPEYPEVTFENAFEQK